ncbi:MAG: hypothetical protein JXA89_00635, partial [Anaerolineae bacterium]|nr:hypothetical protein [Anaerolineae bacterium]
MAKTPNLLIVSDLHLSGGYYAPQASEARGGQFSDLEDFFCDEAFFSLVSHHVAQGGKWQFILNGDIVDFLQVIDLPDDEDVLAGLRPVLRPGRDWERWKDKKRQYGLGTTAIETCWKLEQIVAGHRVFFLALA